MDSLYNSVNKSLQLFIKGREAKIEPPPADFKPIFSLLDIKPDLVCFSSLGEDFEDDYLNGFTNFKNLYTINATKWADYDLSLVFCKTIRNKITDEFCNKVEMDPYFCRKFVIDSEKLDSELSRLPFTPLYPENITGLQRAPSAQTFLKRHSMNADLAKYLAVPYSRNEKGIIEDCCGGLLGNPEWQRGEKEEFSTIKETDRSKIRLKSLELCNFRAYRKPLKFDLDANLVVLYGPNGFGKTSFFDAIDFICTGSVGRFENRRFKPDRLIKALSHLDTVKDDSFVKGVICKDDKDIVLTRQIKDRAHAYLNNDLKDRTKILMELVGLSEEPPDLRVDNLARLFRSSHLFGQEFQTLTANFKDDSMLPQETVSSMLALQDYVEAIAKSNKVVEDLRRQINEKNVSVEALNASLKTYAAEVDNLRQSAKMAENPEMIMLMGKQLTEKLKQHIDISADMSKDINRDIVRGWRAGLESEIANSSQKIEAIKEVKEKFEDYQNYNKSLTEKTVELKNKKEISADINKNYADKNKAFEVSEEKIKSTLLKEKELVIKKENLGWLVEAKIENEKMKKEVQDENNNYKLTASKLSELSSKAEIQKVDIGTKEKSINKLTIGINSKKDKLKRLVEFKKDAAGCKKLLNKRKELEACLNNTQIEGMMEDLRNRKAQLNKILLEHNDLKQSIDSIQQSQTELQTLLDGIEKFVIDNKCPACGAVHQTKQDLINKISRRKGVQPEKLQGSLQLLQDIKSKMRLCEKDVSTLEIKISQLTQETKTAQKELDDIKAKVKVYEQTASSFGIDIDDSISDSIDSLEKNLGNEINREQKELLDLTAKLKEQREQHDLLVSEETKLRQSLNSIEAKRKQLQSMIEKNQETALNKQLSLSRKEQSVQSDLIKIEDSLEKLKKQTKVLQDEGEKLQEEISLLLKRKNNLEREVTNLGKEIIEANKFIDDMNITLRKWNLEPDINKLSLIKDDLSERVFNINSLSREVINFETALDSMQTSATLANILKEMENIKVGLKNTEAEVSTFKKWLLYFESINKNLGSVQKRSLSEYITKYGPLSTAIQRRLRSAYGFKEIDLLQEKGCISVRVSRKEQKNITPSDYFSESQMQILMLSLFLSATLTQTWSAFAPILLDDPVTHFDDLNAYSLLELIKGLIGGSEKSSPQFIISTCEERLFRLMRQKFSGMKERVIFYEFESLGEAGPTIKKYDIQNKKESR